MNGDRIEIRGLRLVGTHGLLPEERSRPQPFEIDLDLAVDMTAAAASDSLGDTADYGAVIESAAVVVAGPAHDLLESLAGAIATAVLAHSPISSATVTVRKQRPPVAYDVASTGVCITRP